MEQTKIMVHDLKYMCLSGKNISLVLFTHVNLYEHAIQYTIVYLQIYFNRSLHFFSLFNITLPNKNICSYISGGISDPVFDALLEELKNILPLKTDADLKFIHDVAHPVAIKWLIEKYTNRTTEEIQYFLTNCDDIRKTPLPCMYLLLF